MQHSFGRVIGPIMVFMLVATACQATTPSIEPASSGPAFAPSVVPASPSAAPSSAPDELPSASVAPSVAPPASARPASATPASSRPVANPWSKPSQIRRGPCYGVTATIDASGRYHVASVCGGRVRYLTSANGIDWARTTFVPPTGRLEFDPQVTQDGSTIYLANSLMDPTEGGCGDDGLKDLGVYVRSLKIGGSWSDPVRVGEIGDRLQSFRAASGVLHLTVMANNGAGSIYYESQSGPAASRIRIPDALTTSLRVGDDGHPRIAYSTGGAIRYARVDGTQLSIATVAATNKTFLIRPSLVLGPHDHAYVVWTQTTYPPGSGCAGPEAGPLDGTYFGTDASGTWTSTRLTKNTGETSLTLDPATGRIEVVANKGSALVQYESPNGVDWTSTRIPDSVLLSEPLLRMNPATGSVNLFAFDYKDGIYLATRP